MNLTPAETYAGLILRYEKEKNFLKAKMSQLSVIRLLIFIGAGACIYLAIKFGLGILLLPAIGLLLVFFSLIRRFERFKLEMSLAANLEGINRSELSAFERWKGSGKNGEEYVKPDHPYSYDLDLFGTSSLFSFIDRTSTEFGETQLANALTDPDISAIPERQAAILELREKPNWRQLLQATGQLNSMPPEALREMMKWLKQPPLLADHPWKYRVLLLFPAVSISVLIAAIFTGNEFWLYLLSTLIPVNLIVVFSFGQRMAKQVQRSDRIYETLQAYARQLKLIEEESWQAPLLSQQQKQLRDRCVSASGAIARLGRLFNMMDSVFNLAVSLPLNGVFCFHLHVLHRLEKWKLKYISSVEGWWKALGKMEELSSLAQFAYNSPEFCTPSLHTAAEIRADALGHPLISVSERICNNLRFQEGDFMILTGSNMSGKSTFLRTLGVNLVLARAGSVVCAKEFDFYPFDLHVSMRITDSLQDSTSFFYAELKRLKAIIEHLQKNKKTFVLLDEILRGTNSHDKHEGTIGLLRKMMALGATGVLATHDLTVTDMTSEFPQALHNYCFESSIESGELTFDYLLKPGVCSTLSASFLMKKMKVIE